jgi:hypothetical protein
MTERCAAKNRLSSLCAGSGARAAMKKQCGLMRVASRRPAVEGPMVFKREVNLYVHKTARIGQVTGATAVRSDGSTAPKE